MSDQPTDDASTKPPTKFRRRRSVARARHAARRSVAVFPTLCTLANLLCGFLAVFFASRPADTELPWGWTPLTFAAVFVFLGILFDGIDGPVARLTGSTSDLGGQLDSMADLVTAGVAPAFMAVQLAGVESPFLSIRGDRYFDRAALIIACLYVACTALRLARFNVDVRSEKTADHMSFCGLPSPGAAGTVAGLILLHEHLLAHSESHWVIKIAACSILTVTAVAAFAMVSRLPYAHLANRYLLGRAPFNYLLMLVVAALLLAIAPQWSIAIGFVCYALSAPVMRLPGARRALRRLRKARPLESSP